MLRPFWRFEVNQKQQGRVAEIWFRTLCAYRDAGVSFGDVNIPTYIKNAKACPNICKATLDSASNRATCLKFYRELPTSEAVRVECPFGLTVSYAKAIINNQQVLVAKVEGISASGLRLSQATAYPRVDKKTCTEALNLTANYQFSGSIPLAELNQVIDLLETLSYGRLALAIRGFSHELLTPVQGLKNDIAQLPTGTTSELSQSILFNLHYIESTAKKIQVIISDGLSIGPKSLRRITVRNMIRSIAQRLTPTAAERKIVINIGFNRDFKEIDAVPDLLELALSCLLENAVKYSFEGFPDRFNIVEVRFYSEGPCLGISISNQGCLIADEEIRERTIFELGVRGIYSTDRNRKGSGNGLYIADQIARAHRGEIRVTSKKIPNPEGTPIANNVFSIALPVHPELDWPFDR
jgi:signal transduction histidine kinase